MEKSHYLVNSNEREQKRLNKISTAKKDKNKNEISTMCDKLLAKNPSE